MKIQSSGSINIQSSSYCHFQRLQFLMYSSCSEVDKFLFAYVILKLKLIKGKCIIFVNNIERSYRLKLFLEQFSIKTCVLNSELPLNSRCALRFIEVNLYSILSDITLYKNSTKASMTMSLQQMKERVTTILIRTMKVLLRTPVMKSAKHVCVI